MTYFVHFAENSVFNKISDCTADKTETQTYSGAKFMHWPRNVKEQSLCDENRDFSRFSTEINTFP